MSDAVADAIARARKATTLTQIDLARRLGLRGRALSRWEAGKAEPSRRNLEALVTTLHALAPEAAITLKQTLIQHGKLPKPPAAAPAQASAALVSRKLALERAVYAMADELDLPPRRARGALLRLLKRLQAADLTLEQTQRKLEAWQREDT